jgi:peptidoglycan hydrolase-like protein with peptidoglycan-binding domain
MVVSLRAIRSFQADQGFPVTGQVDARLLRALRIEWGDEFIGP